MATPYSNIGPLSDDGPRNCFKTWTSTCRGFEDADSGLASLGTCGIMYGVSLIAFGCMYVLVLPTFGACVILVGAVAVVGLGILHCSQYRCSPRYGIWSTRLAICAYSVIAAISLFLVAELSYLAHVAPSSTRGRVMIITLILVFVMSACCALQSIRIGCKTHSELAEEIEVEMKESA
eukprot:TRINITY_DN36250_c0_g1_i2.p1 TRINITY_DN36250_c0_g1~~TRINITY_DN36250_c0_g1_i2.p1  ORF type:complete len:178 (-),score=4.81 TRINITY_DN36250_c0_g1_i2:141-674(-)